MATHGWEVPKGKAWTYGAELELVDWDQRRGHRWRMDMDWTMVNSNGIAVDPRGKVYHLGGEVLLEPSTTPGGAAEQLAEFVKLFPEARVNYRTNLHVHVRIPGLRDNLRQLKRLQQYCSTWLPELLPIIDPIPEPSISDYTDLAAWKGARRRFARRKVSHHKIMPASGLKRQMAARTTEQFFQAEALHETSGRVLWATHPRCAVNLRQMLATDTIEFRHFPGTADPAELDAAVKWCRHFLQLALDGSASPLSFARKIVRGSWPSFRPYVHSLEETYRVTNPHYVGVQKAAQNIARILG